MKKALNLTILKGMGISQEEAIPQIAEAGFDGCFWVCEAGVPVSQIAEKVRGAGLFMEFIHAPVKKVDTMWMAGEEGDDRLSDLLFWMHQCADNQIPYMVSHVWTKFAPIEPNPLGLSRFGTLLDEAQKCGVQIAFENAEVGKFLTAVMENFRTHPAACFCWDTGHELCYNGGEDQLAQFGDRLRITHLNDNLGQTGPEITSADDIHLMPFDGLIDWPNIARRLQNAHYIGTLTYELKMQNKPNKHTHDHYLSLTPQAILHLAHSKALQFEALLK